jgi:hypothetical protein
LPELLIFKNKTTAKYRTAMPIKTNPRYSKGLLRTTDKRIPIKRIPVPGMN